MALAPPRHACLGAQRRQPRGWLFVFAGCVCAALALAACSADTTKTSGSDAGIVPVEGNPTESTAPGDVPGEAPTAELTVEADLVLGSGEFTLADTASGLAELAGYRATLVMSFVGTRAGAAEEWSATYTMLTTKEPATRQLTIEKSGDLPDVSDVMMAEVAGVAYEQLGDGACNATLIEEGLSLGEQMEPASLLIGVYGAEEASSETVAGIAAQHYTFDDAALGQQGVTTSTGEMWVASDRPLVVKYLLTTQGGTTYFGDELEGTVSWDYQLTDVDASVPFVVPDGCPAGLVDAPLLPDATDVSSVPGVLSFQTSSSVADASAFYTEQILALGWSLQDPPTVSDSVTLLPYQRGGQMLTVIITSGTTTTVTIVLEP